MQLQTRIYQKEHNKSLFSYLNESLKDIIGSRFLAKQLAVRDIKAQYRQSYFGLLWAFITPLTTAFVWIFLSATGTVKLTDTGVPYPLYAFTGTLLWSILKEAINSPTSNTNAARGMLSKINFPKEALVISGIYKLLFNSVVKIVLLLIFLIIYGIGFHPTLLFFPFALFGVLLFGTTIGLLITPIGMLYKDVARFINLALGFLMYATPVVYVVPKNGVLKTIMELNPLTALIATARDLAIGLSPSYLSYYFILMLVCVPILCVALVFYRISIPIIVERMSA